MNETVCKPRAANGNSGEPRNLSVGVKRSLSKKQWEKGPAEAGNQGCKEVLEVEASLKENHFSMVFTMRSNLNSPQEQKRYT